MAEDKKDVMLSDLQKNIEEIKAQVKEIKCDMRRVNAFLLILISVVLIASVSLVGLGVSFKHNIEDKLKIITIEYNKVKSLENSVKKLMPWS